MDVSSILQAITKQRSEHCCSTLISCLITCKTTEVNGKDDDESDTSSVEILRALTTQLNTQMDAAPRQSVQFDRGPRLSISLTPTPGQHFITELTEEQLAEKRRAAQSSPLLKPPTMDESETQIHLQDPAIHFFDEMVLQGSYHTGSDPDHIDLLENLIMDEEIFLANILMKCIKICPTAFDKDIDREEMMKWVNKGSRSLWTQIGGMLEHVVLWWSTSPLACRPSACARYLRDWLLLICPEDAPEPINSMLQSLGETLTVHVCNTIWDRQFRLTLVSASLPVDYPFSSSEFVENKEEVTGTICGKLWGDLLNQLVTIGNSCDQKGTIANELPIAEQIPVLHRLDHSIHSMRNWAAEKSKSVCTDWNMMMFFKVVHDDVNLCVEQLRSLRAPVLAVTDPLEVHVKVCVALRAKLVQEILENYDKLKNMTRECIEVLSAICRTTSLASLTLCFPPLKLWQTNELQKSANDYVSHYLNQIYLPVIQATKDKEILKLTLKIICEAWLDHIYSKKTKFSYCGAVNLLKDFDGVADWIQNCDELSSEYQDVLSKHEVLRMCEGVGRLLLRKPDEIISILPSPSKVKKSEEGMMVDFQYFGYFFR
jgi:hypothetical protein